MSLMERVALTQGRSGEPYTGEVCSLDQMLRTEFNKYITSDELAELIGKHPHQARNEIKSICAQVFTAPTWSMYGEETKEKLVNRLIDVVFGLGAIQPLIEDPQVSEIMVNAVDEVFYEQDGRLYQSSIGFANTEQIRTMIDRIVSPLGRRVDEESPMVDARLPQGYRVNVVIPPIAIDGPLVTIRKFRKESLSLCEMVSQQNMTKEVSQLLTWAVRARKNIIVSGGTGSGKTTLLNALSDEISKAERIVTIEDSAELRLSSQLHVVRLESRSANSEGVGEITIRDLVANALRMRPDRIIVGECRGAEALDMLQAMNTGHDGSLTTLHANSSADMIVRLTTMVRFGVDLPVDVVEQNIASAVDVVVHVGRNIEGQRFVQELSELVFDCEQRICHAVALYERKNFNDRGTWLSFPSWIEGSAIVEDISQEEVLAWQERCLS